MNIEIRKSADGDWDLFVNGRAYILSESFAVVDQVKQALEHPNAHTAGEIGEVSDAMKQRGWGDHRAERIQGHEDTPLSLTKRQRQRILALLTEEFGPVSAARALERIEKEV